MSETAPGPATALLEAAAHAWDVTPTGTPQPIDGPGRHWEIGAVTRGGRDRVLRVHAAADLTAVTARCLLTEALADAGFACPWPERTSAGALALAVEGGGVASLRQRAEGETSLTAARSLVDLAACGALLADFHLTAEAVGPALPPCQPAIRAADGVAIVHAGVSPRTVQRIGGHLWLFGFDRAGKGPAMYDLACALAPFLDQPDAAQAAKQLGLAYRNAGGWVNSATWADCLVPFVQASGSADAMAVIAGLRDGSLLG